MTTATITIPAKVALRTGLYLIWQAIRHPRSGVTFEMSSDPPPPLPRDERGRFRVRDEGPEALG